MRTSLSSTNPSTAVRTGPATVGSLGAPARPVDRAAPSSRHIRRSASIQDQAQTLRRQLYSIRLNASGCDFYERLRRDAATLAEFRGRLDDGTLPDELQSFAHKLAGAAGVFNFLAVSAQASALEEAVIAARTGCGTPETVAANLDALIACVERAKRDPLGEREARTP